MKEKIKDANSTIREAIRNAVEVIIEAVKANGGYINTSPKNASPALRAAYSDGYSYDPHAERTEVIHGISLDENGELTLCTDSMLGNYEFDTGYKFGYLYDMDDKDERELLNALQNEAYYENLEDYFIFNETIQSIISGLDWYVN